VEFDFTAFEEFLNRRQLKKPTGKAIFSHKELNYCYVKPQLGFLFEAFTRIL